MRESKIEARLRNKIKDLGGLALKFLPTFLTGMPDRLILMPGAKVCWAETKATGKDLRKLQRVRKKMLEKLGFKVFKVDSYESLDLFLKEVLKL